MNPKRHPCRVCGVWKCGQCGWTRRPANRLRPDLQYCSRCESKTGEFLDVRHTSAYIQAEHDVDAEREEAKQRRSTKMTDTILDLTKESPQEAIGIAMGAVSVCWENPGGAGVFDSTRARLICEELTRYLGLEGHDHDR